MDIDTPPNNWSSSQVHYQIAAPGPEVEMEDASPVRHQQQAPMQHMVNRVVKVSSTRRRKANNNTRSLTRSNSSFHREEEDATWEEVQSQSDNDQEEEQEEEEESDSIQQHQRVSRTRARIHSTCSLAYMRAQSNGSLRRVRPTRNAEQVLYYGDHHHHYATSPTSATPVNLATWDPARASAWFALLANSSVFAGAASLFAYILYVFIVDVRNKAKQQTRSESSS